MFEFAKKMLKKIENICYNFLKGELYMIAKAENKTYSAMDIARYVVNYANEQEMIVSNLKLQKILYFIQMEFLIERKAICFKDDIEAWDFGPVVPAVYREFKKYGALNIPKIIHYYDDSDGVWNVKKIEYKPQICEQDRRIIDSVINECSNYSASQLVEITHQQTPWIKAYQKGKNSVISIDSINTFINTYIKADSNG